MTDVIMPKMGDAMEEGMLLEWLKKEGDSVKSGEIIGTIQTDKATLELEAPASGKLAGILIQNGQTVAVGKSIAAILKDGEALPKTWGSGSGVSAKEVPAPASAAMSPKSGERPTEPQMAIQVPATSGRIKASPLARKIAEESGIDLQRLTGTGPDGRIVERDVRAGVEKQKPAILSSPPAASGPDTFVQLNRLRQITAQRTAQSKQQVPHFYVTVEVDLEAIMQLRAMFEREESGKISVNDFVVKACAIALTEMPEVNASFEGDKIRLHGAVHIGIAAAIEDGLTLPVIHEAQALSLRQIALSTRDLVWKARENKLSLDELSGATFSISNMGMLEVDNFAAIIVQPNAGILAISTAQRKPVADENDQISVRWRMNITGSFDHRVVDGAIGAKFMNKVRTCLENPTRLLA